ncbi:unnamed protein product [Rotaria sordida]|uniref:Uncharacterized protein n=1 Tax=Rotaria sordida TaxID=392033 RepID=A0A813Z9S8_9BILA|nr:unnamed protein product [Rotaria sordida]
MSVLDIIRFTGLAIKGAYKLAIAIRDSESIHVELKQAASLLITDLKMVEDILDHLQHFAHRIAVHDQSLLTKNITMLRSTLGEVQTILEDVVRDRNFLERLLMKKDDYRRQLREISAHLHELCHTIEGAIPTMTKIEISCREFSDFRRKLLNVPDKTLSLYGLSFKNNTPHSVIAVTNEEFDATKVSFYMKVHNEQVIFSYQLRTWSTLNLKSLNHEERLRRFRESLRVRKNPGHHDSTSSLGLTSSKDPLPKLTTALSQTSVAAPTNSSHEQLDFSEFFMSHDDICGMTLTQSFIYIATKYEIRIVSLDKKKIIAQYGTEGNGPNKFKHISYLYIPRNDETNLYVVDRGQYCVQHYKINDTGLHFKHVHQYVVIANVSQGYNLVSCVIYNENLYVSDDANNCLHIFPLNRERQSNYLVDKSMPQFSPGSLCVHDKYLYVADRSSKGLGILVFNEQWEIIDWFRNSLLKEVLAMDIVPDINKLYILTTTQDENNKRKRPLIASMDLVIRPRQ